MMAVDVRHYENKRLIKQHAKQKKDRGTNQGKKDDYPDENPAGIKKRPEKKKQGIFAQSLKNTNIRERL